MALVQRNILDAYGRARDIALEAYNDHPTPVPNEAGILATPRAPSPAPRPRKIGAAQTVRRVHIL